MGRPAGGSHWRMVPSSDPNEALRGSADRLQIGNGHSLNSLKNCLDQWIHFTSPEFFSNAQSALPRPITQLIE
jgi:hypothetical protein